MNIGSASDDSRPLCEEQCLASLILATEVDMASRCNSYHQVPMISVCESLKLLFKR